MTNGKRPAVLAVCGMHRSGKTSLIEELVPGLRGRGLNVLVVKRAGERLEVDHEGKDSARLFQAGADALAYDETQSFLRRHGTAALKDVLRRIGGDYDVVLVEGHKGSPLPKVWLMREDGEPAPEGLENLLAVLPPGPGRAEQALRILDKELASRQ